MALRHVLWTLLLSSVLTCSICGVLKVRSYGAVQYQNAARQPERHVHAAAFQPRSAVKGAGAPYNPLPWPDQQSTLRLDQGEDVQRQPDAVEGEVAPVIREQVKMIPVFHGRPDPSAQSQVIQFGSAKTERTSPVIPILSGYSPAGGGDVLGGVLSHSLAIASLAERRREHRRPTLFGSGQSTGTTSASSHYTGTSLYTESLQTASVDMRYPGSRQYIQSLNAASSSVLTAGSRPGITVTGRPTYTRFHHGSRVQPTTRFMPGGAAPSSIWGSSPHFGTTHYGYSRGPSHFVTRRPVTSSAGSVKGGSGSADHRQISTHYGSSRGPPSHFVTRRPVTSSAGSVKGGSGSADHRQISTHYGSSRGPPSHFVTRKPVTSSAGSVKGGSGSADHRQISTHYGSSRGPPSHFVTRKPVTSSAGSVKGGSGSADHRQISTHYGSSRGPPSHFVTRKPVTSSAGSVKGGSGSADHRQITTHYGYRRTAGYTRIPATTVAHYSATSKPVYVHSDPSRSAGRYYGYYGYNQVRS